MEIFKKTKRSPQQDLSKYTKNIILKNVFTLKMQTPLFLVWQKISFNKTFRSLKCAFYLFKYFLYILYNKWVIAGQKRVFVNPISRYGTKNFV